MCGLPSIWNLSKYKTWREKSVGSILYPHRLKSGGHVPRVPHQIAPIFVIESFGFWESSQ